MIFASSIDSIEIYDLKGKVEISVHDKNEVQVHTNDEEQLDIGEIGSTLTIKTKKANTSGRDNLVFFGSNITIFNNSTIFGNNANIDLAQVDMKIYVPRNVIESLSISGSITVEAFEISKKLKVSNSGATNIVLTETSFLKLSTSGCSNVQATGVSEIDANVSDACNVSVEGSDLSVVKTNISGTSVFNIKCDTISDLRGNVSGVSKLYIDGIIDRKHINRSGLASIIHKGAF